MPPILRKDMSITPERAEELELDKKELRILLHEAENALDTLGYLEVKRWNNIIRD